MRQSRANPVAPPQFGSLALSKAEEVNGRVIWWDCGILYLVFTLLCLAIAAPLKAQTLNTTDFQIEWKVTNRFRLFNDASFFKLHENAWRQYLIHVNEQKISDEQKSQLIASSSVLGAEHVLNDRYIAFSRLERSKFDWRGWAAQGEGRLCWNPKSRMHDFCGDVDGLHQSEGSRD